MPKWAIYRNTDSGGMFSALLFSKGESNSEFIPDTLLGREELMPALVFSSGGYETRIADLSSAFDATVFIELRDFKKTELEPLSFSEIIPYNHVGFTDGWIDRQGNTYSCSRNQHYLSACAIAEHFYNCMHDGQRELEKRGWLHVSQGGMQMYPSGVNFDSDTVPSAAQIKKVYELNVNMAEFEEKLEFARFRSRIRNHSE